MLKKGLMIGAAILVSAPLSFTALAQSAPQNAPGTPPASPMEHNAPSTTAPDTATAPGTTAPQTANAPATTKGDVMKKNSAITADGSMSANSLIGADVRNNANETIGSVEDVFIGKDGAVKGVVVGVGGFLGVGKHDVLLSWDKVQLREDDDHDGLVVATDATKDSLKAMPEYTSR